MATKELKDKFEKVCSQGQQIQKTLKYHQNKLKSMFSNPKTDNTVLESALDKLATVYTKIDACINQDYPQLKFNFFPSNMDVSYSVKYAGGTFPNDLTLCHNKKSKLKEIRSSLKRKIISKELSKVSCVEENDCVIAVDMKRMVVRGVVTGITHQIVKLLDIDTGDYKNAVVDNIYELDEEAVSLYALCVRCRLDGDLTDLKEFWTADLSHYLISALNYGELVIETSHYVDESSIPPRFKVTIEVFVDDTKVLNINQWVCEQLLPLVKKEAQNCLDLQKVIQGLDPKVLMPYMEVASGVSTDSLSNLSDSVVNSSQIISSPESSARSSSSESSEEYSVDIQIDKFDTPSFLPSPSNVVNGSALSSGKKEIDVYFTNENMVASPSSESLVAERSKSKCDCGTDCAPIVGSCPLELLQSNPKVPRIATVIPSLANIPHDTGGSLCQAELHPIDPCFVTSNSISNSNLPPAQSELQSSSVLPHSSEPHDLKDGEPFYYKMKNKSKSSLLPTPSTTHTNTSGDTHRSESEHKSMESAFYNKSNGRLQPDGMKHRSDNSLSSSSPSHLASSSRRGPRSHLYTLPLPSYMTEANGYGAGVNASAGDGFVGGVGYPEEKLVPLSGLGGSGPNSRGEGLSLKPQHFCLAGHLEKVQNVKLPRSILMVEPGQERKALISFTETPSKFFVNIVDENNAHLEQLEEELCAHYSQVNNLVSLVTIEEARYHLGEYVAAKWKSDNRWYRARVMDWNVYTKNSISIHYVDHGNVDLVPLDYIQPLEPQFTQYAIMALPCHLAHVTPSSSSGWSQDAIDMFSQFCDKSLEVFYLTFQPSSSNDVFCSWSVVMRNAQGDCINELLVSAGHATHTVKINGHTAPTPALTVPVPAQSPTPTPLTPAPLPDRGHPVLSRIQGLVKQIQDKNANINSSSLETTKSNANFDHETTKSNANSVHETMPNTNSDHETMPNANSVHETMPNANSDHETMPNANSVYETTKSNANFDHETTKSNANSVHEGKSDSSRYETPEPYDEVLNQLVSREDTYDKFDDNIDLIDLNNVYEPTMDYSNNSHDIDLNTENKHIEPDNIIDHIEESLIESNYSLHNDMSNIYEHIVSGDKPNNIDSMKNKVNESYVLTNRDQNQSEIVSVGESYVSASLSVRRYLNNQSTDTSASASTVGLISYKADGSGVTTLPGPGIGVIPIPELEENLVDGTLTEASYTNHGRLSRNSNISCVSSEGLVIVEQLLNKCHEDIELTNQRLSNALEIQHSNTQHLVDNEKKLVEIGTFFNEIQRNNGELSNVNARNRNEVDNTVDMNNLMKDIPRNVEMGLNNLDKAMGDIEVKELNVATTNLRHRTEPLIEVKELNVPRTESQVLNNNMSERNRNTSLMNQDENILLKKLNNNNYNSERIVNQLKSPIPHVQALKNTNYKTNSDSIPSTSNQYNSEYDPSNTNQYQTNTNFECNLPNKKQYISQIMYNPSHCTTNHHDYTSYSTNNNSPTYGTNEKENKTLSGIDENLNENLLVSSSESSARRGKLPPIIKKPPQRKLVKENLNTILTKMPIDEMEKQKMIEQFVDNSLQQAKQSGNIVDDNSYDTQDSKHRNKARLGQTESRRERDNNRQGSNKYNEKHLKNQNFREKRLNDLGDNNSILYNSNLSLNLLPDYDDVNQLESKDQARLNNQLETNVQDRMPNDQDKDQKKMLKEDKDRRFENENRISPYNNEQVESREDEIMHEDQNRAAKEHHRMPLSEELGVKKKTSSRGRPRKYSKHAEDFAGPSLKSLAQKKNIFECLKQASNSNSANVSSEETSSDVPSDVRTSEPKPHRTDKQNNATHKSNPSTLSKTTNTVQKSNSSAITNTKDNRGSPNPSLLSNTSSQSFITHKPGQKSEEAAASRSKTEKWFWLTLQQETLLKSKSGKTIKVRVMRIPAVGEFYCQTVGVFPEYELGFKTLFYNSNSPQVYSQFKPMSSIRPGKLVMVSDPNSNKWYRSEVQDKVEGQDLFKVFFVDFGTEAFVPGSSIREIQPDYTQIPYQAIHCQLHNISVCPNPEFVESEDYIKYLRIWTEMLRVGQTYEVKIMEVDSNLVRITLEDSGGFDMGELLALSCSTPFVELKSNRLQGAWSDFVYD